MGFKNTIKGEAFSLNDALAELRKDIPLDVVEKIHERALAIAMGQHLSSTHEIEDHQQILSAMNDGDMDCLERFEVVFWEPFEDETPEHILGLIQATAFSIEESMLWACSLSKTTKTVVQVAHWDNYDGGVRPQGSHEISVDDQRVSNGQVFIDISKIKVLQETVEISPAVTVEIGLLPGIPEKNVDVPVVHLHFDNSNMAASFFHEDMGGGRSRFLMRLESGVTVDHLSEDMFEITSNDFCF